MNTPLPRQGEVFALPPENLPQGDVKWRRHVLVSNVTAEAETAVLAWASTRLTEAQHGAKYVLIDPAATKYRESGFSEPSYVYPCRLVSIPREDLGDAVGHIREATAPLLRLLKHSLGIGTGTCEQGQAVGSPRGKIVKLWPSVGRLLGTQYGLLITEARYSERRRYQTVVPVLNGAKMEAMAGDVTISKARWLTDLNYELAILAIADIRSLWHGDHIEALTRTVVDGVTMRAVDEALCGLFGL